MSSELAKQTHSNQAVSIAMSMPELTQVAKGIAESRLFPGIDTDAKALTLMLLCQSEGLHPMQAVKRYHIIKGRPSMRSDAMQAEFQAAGGSIRWEVTSNVECAATFFHPKHTPPEGILVGFTIDDARQAELLGNDTWRKWPAAMLRSRVVTIGVRMVLPGIVVGIPSQDELEDETSGVPSSEIGSIPSNSARVLTSSPMPSADAPEVSEAVTLPTQNGKVDQRPYHEVVKAEVADFNAMLAKEAPGAETISVFQIHRHLLKAAAKQNLAEAFPEGSKPGNAAIVERCQTLYAQHRNWTRKELDDYLSAIFQEKAPKQEEQETETEAGTTSITKPVD